MNFLLDNDVPEELRYLLEHLRHQVSRVREVEIIDPRDTRPLLCASANLTARLRRVGPSTHRMRP